MSGWWRGLNPVLLLVGVALALAGSGVMLAWWWQHHQRQAAEARLGRAETAAASKSAREAIETIGRAQGREAAGEALSRSNREEIEHGQGSDAAVGRGVHDAGIDGLCRRAAYRDSERCRLRRAGAE